MSENTDIQAGQTEKKDRNAAIELSDEKKNTLSSLKDRFKNMNLQVPKPETPPEAPAAEKKEKISVDAIVERGKKKEDYYGTIGKKRAKETAEKKENNERVKQSSFRLALKFFSLFNRLKGRAMQYDRTLTYEILFKYSLDQFDKMDDKKIIEVIDTYRE